MGETTTGQEAHRAVEAASWCRRQFDVDERWIRIDGIDGNLGPTDDKTTTKDRRLNEAPEATQRGRRPWSKREIQKLWTWCREEKWEEWGERRCEKQRARQKARAYIGSGGQDQCQVAKGTLFKAVKGTSRAQENWHGAAGTMDQGASQMRLREACILAMDACDKVTYRVKSGPALPAMVSSGSSRQVPVAVSLLATTTTNARYHIHSAATLTISTPTLGTTSTTNFQVRQRF
ncbi:hypothetical protein DFH06DRAFT_1136041 [Mycena polygramma]|nr:hypothetical protein DFH06DRAFT_1136041 [Mycena polygramma]